MCSLECTPDLPVIFIVSVYIFSMCILICFVNGQISNMHRTVWHLLRDAYNDLSVKRCSDYLKKHGIY